MRAARSAATASGAWVWIGVAITATSAPVSRISAGRSAETGTPSPAGGRRSHTPVSSARPAAARRRTFSRWWRP
ncbi:hypothetical protein LUX57_11145 [Actinomadura madurae]|nr:hypothetical protein [Actinomadura madurae]MCP9965615.1 hypothetical protein [Actinomadura madurae]